MKTCLNSYVEKILNFFLGRFLVAGHKKTAHYFCFLKSKKQKLFTFFQRIYQFCHINDTVSRTII